MHTSSRLTLTYLFRILCLVFTILMVSYWCYTYDQDDDLVTVDYKAFDNSKATVLPTVSICVDNPFPDKKLEQIDKNLNSSTYRQFLTGRVYGEMLADVDYENVTIQHSDYTEGDAQLIMFKTGNSSNYNKTFLTYLKEPYVSYDGFLYSEFVKCFAYELQDSKKDLVKAIFLPFNQKLFSGSDRNTFYIYLHYPGQFLIAPDMTRLSWSDLRTDRKTALRLGINFVEVLQRRNKRRAPCIDNAHEFDNMIKNVLIEEIGCRPPYQKSTSHWPICTSMEDMLRHKGVNPGLMNPTKQYGIAPCKEMSIIQSKIDKWTVGPGHDVRLIVIPSFPEQYRSTQLVKAINVQSLIGNAGGYIGLFLGKNAQSILIRCCTKYIDLCDT